MKPMGCERLRRWGTGALVMTAAIVQLVSPWEQPVPPACRRLRLRYS